MLTMYSIQFCRIIQPLSLYQVIRYFFLVIIFGTIWWWRLILFTFLPNEICAYSYRPFLTNSKAYLNISFCYSVLTIAFYKRSNSILTDSQASLPLYTVYKSTIVGLSSNSLLLVGKRGHKRRFCHRLRSERAQNISTVFLQVTSKLYLPIATCKISESRCDQIFRFWVLTILSKRFLHNGVCLHYCKIETKPRCRTEKCRAQLCICFCNCFRKVMAAQLKPKRHCEVFNERNLVIAHPLFVFNWSTFLFQASIQRRCSTVGSWEWSTPYLRTC